ncbi:hypothetical protein [Candidatus Venteria ishoeyi]|uniref:Uncharacterized protein n=1 Tax=Candidatus Venteria ishoeyi TaxID=1899563 RepID=A0A1H6F4L8_9GAMM|nr:hypothetical protein [Candidatus Venteria ishoeyi]SEH04321.1 Uncharacterised protein [Candidatus Venteria ishoeyi]
MTTPYSTALTVDISPTDTLKSLQAKLAGLSIHQLSLLWEASQAAYNAEVALRLQRKEVKK